MKNEDLCKKIDDKQFTKKQTVQVFLRSKACNAIVELWHGAEEREENLYDTLVSNTR